jgi:hypothetical protein
MRPFKVRDLVSRPYKTESKIIVFWYFNAIFLFWERNLFEEGKASSNNHHLKATSCPGLMTVDECFTTTPTLPCCCPRTSVLRVRMVCNVQHAATRV